MLNRIAIFALLLALLVPAGCRRPSDTDATPQGSGNDSPEIASTDGPAPIAVANSYLVAALCDLLGQGQPIVALAKPGMCPGHFDLRPSQVRQLHSCRLLVRFDLQESLDSRMSDDPVERPQVIAVNIPGGMCNPASYESVCRQLAKALVEHGRLTPKEADHRVAIISKRMDRLSRRMSGRIDEAQMRGKPVLASGHQAAFCRCLGLNVVATFSSADTAQPSQIDRAIASGEAAGVRLIVANVPEGRKLADALADRLGAKVAVLDNFPDGQDRDSFDALVRHNVDALVEASRP